MTLNLQDATGKHPDVPVCPDHPKVALIHELRYRDGGKQAAGFWRCPVDNKVYVDYKPLQTPL